MSKADTTYRGDKCGGCEPLSANKTALSDRSILFIRIEIFYFELVQHFNIELALINYYTGELFTGNFSMQALVRLCKCRDLCGIDGASTDREFESESENGQKNYFDESILCGRVLEITAGNCDNYPIKKSRFAISIECCDASNHKQLFAMDTHLIIFTYWSRSILSHTILELIVLRALLQRTSWTTQYSSGWLWHT